MQPYKIDITAMGREGVNVIKKFIVDALRNDLKLDESDTTNIFVSSDSWMGNWEKAMEKKKRDKTKKNFMCLNRFQKFSFRPQIQILMNSHK